MPKHRIDTAVSMFIDRNFPPEAFGHVAKTLESSRVVDSILMWDQLMSWIPPCLWTPENTPLAKVVPDIDSYPDWNIMVGYAWGARVGCTARRKKSPPTYKASSTSA